MYTHTHRIETFYCHGQKHVRNTDLETIMIEQ